MSNEETVPDVTAAIAVLHALDRLQSSPDDLQARQELQAAIRVIGEQPGIQETVAAMDRCSALVQRRYETTDATASECLDQLTNGLLDMGVEPDICPLWQVLFQMAGEEEASTSDDEDDDNESE